MVLSDREFLAEWMTFFGTRRGLTLFAWVVQCGVLAPPDVDRRWLIEKAPGSMTSRYRNVAHLEQFLAHMDRHGYTLDESDTQRGARLAWTT